MAFAFRLEEAGKSERPLYSGGREYPFGQSCCAAYCRDSGPGTGRGRSGIIDPRHGVAEAARKESNELAEGAVFLFKNRPLDLDRSEEHTSELQSLMRIS